MKQKIFLAFSVFLLLSVLIVGTAFAQGEGPAAISDDEVNAIAKELYCPVCESTPLDVCPTQACAEWREDIRDKLAQGLSGDEIKQYFVNRYGDRVIAAPPARGFNWLVYILPPLAILLGAIFLLRAMMLWRKQALQPEQVKQEAQQQEISQNELYYKKLEEELKKR